MHTGKIKKVIRDRGFGFISDTDGREIFFHQKNLNGLNFETLKVEDSVTFEVEKSDKGPFAVNVESLKEEA